MQQSDTGSLNKKDIQKWSQNLIIFSAPLALIYLSSVSAIVGASGHAFVLQDLVPSQLTVGAMVLYTLNALTDLFRKWANG